MCERPGVRLALEMAASRALSTIMATSRPARILLTLRSLNFSNCENGLRYFDVDNIILKS